MPEFLIPDLAGASSLGRAGLIATRRNTLPATKETVIEGFSGPNGGVKAEAVDAAAGGGGEAGAQRVVRQEAEQAVRDRVHVADLHEEPADAVLDGLGVAADVGDDERK